MPLAITRPRNRQSSSRRMPSRMRRSLTCRISKLHSSSHLPHHRCISSRQQAAAPAPSGGLTDDDLAQLKQLGQLHESGVLTDAEFEAAKQKILG